MFKTISSVLNSKSNPTEEEIQKIQPYIFCRWLSGHPGTVLMGNELNRYPNIPVVNQYKMVKTVIQDKIKYIPYPKNEVHNDKVVEILSKHFNESYERARTYLEFIDKKELDYILNLYENKK